MKAYLFSEVDKIGIKLNDLQVQQFIDYYNILIEWNSFMNLTGITEYEEVVIKHFIDSLAIVKAFDKIDFLQNSDFSIIDVGTGAGFPGIPLKIAFPDLKITLLDSLKKRINFLDEVINNLGLKNIYSIHGRAEDYAKIPDYREKFDLCVSRAVANLAVLSEYCLPFVKLGGKFIPYKSEKISSELSEAHNAIAVLGGKFVKQVDYQLYDNYRNFIVIEKVGEVPLKYPRKSSQINKSPL